MVRVPVQIQPRALDRRRLGSKMFLAKPRTLEDPGARKMRYRLYLLGGAFVAAGFALEMVPFLAAVVPASAGRACAGLGAAILLLGRAASDRTLVRLGTLLRAR